jgi:hypothetical protein
LRNIHIKLGVVLGGVDKVEEAMRPLTDDELSRVQDLYRLLPPWKRGEFLQELARRVRGRKLGHADLRREAATAMRAVLGRGHPWVPEAD